MSAGRPNEYKPEYVQEVDNYLGTCKEVVEEFHKTRGEKSDSYERIINVNLPTIEGFALFIGVNKSSLYEWEKDSEEFSHALNKIRAKQHERLVDGGVGGRYNPTIVKLMLMNNHDYREKSDQTTDGKPITGFNYIAPDADDNTDNKTRT